MDDMENLCGLSGNRRRRQGRPAPRHMQYGIHGLGDGPGPAFIFPVGSPGGPAATTPSPYVGTPSSGGGFSPSSLTNWINALSNSAVGVANTVNTIRGKPVIAPPVAPQNNLSKYLLYGGIALLAVAVGAKLLKKK